MATDRQLQPERGVEMRTVPAQTYYTAHAWSWPPYPACDAVSRRPGERTEANVEFWVKEGMVPTVAFTGYGKPWFDADDLRTLADVLEGLAND